MIDEFLDLRNKVHRDKFRFDLSRDLWGCHYFSEEEFEADNVVRIFENKKLRGYAIYDLLRNHDVEMCKVLEICADARDTLFKLIERLIERSLMEGVDFIFLRRCEEPYDEVFDEKDFLTFAESVVMVSLLNPKQLLLSFSKKIQCGKILRLVIKGSDPITLRVGKERIMVIDSRKSELAVYMDGKTFLKLIFGKTSFLKEFLKGKVTISNMLRLRTVLRFFNIVRNNEWYIPTGDWC